MQQLLVDLQRTSKPLGKQPTDILTDDEIAANFRILFATFSGPLADPGYLQGLNYTSCLFHQIYSGPGDGDFYYCGPESEEKSYLSLVALILDNDLRGLYAPSVPEFHLRNFQLKHTLKTLMPDVFIWVEKRLDIKIEAFTTQWVMTLYTGWITDERYMLPIFDRIVAGETGPAGLWGFMFATICALFDQNKHELLRMGDIGEVMRFFGLMQCNQEFGFRSARHFMQRTNHFLSLIDADTLRQSQMDYFFSRVNRQVTMFLTTKTHDPSVADLSVEEVNALTARVQAIEANFKQQAKFFAEKTSQSSKDLAKAEKKNSKTVQKYAVVESNQTKLRIEFSRLSQMRVLIQKHALSMHFYIKRQLIQAAIYEKVRILKH